MIPKIKTGEYEILNSGVFHVVEDENTTITFNDINVVLIFEKNDDGKQALNFKITDSKNTELKLLNTHGLGYGTVKPFQIGESNNKKLFLTFITRSLNDSYLRTFEYTLYTK